jgi:ADP-heptose:LPS heptosyltransferase
LAWAGSPAHKLDRYRSISPETFLPLFQQDDVAFFSLQIGPSGGAESLAQKGLIDLTEQIHDCADTAALIAELDLVVSVDTAVAHLAGALGRPVWTLLPYQPDWRWGLGGEETPWYPTMRLFRQPVVGDWPGVIQRIASELHIMRRSISPS